MCIMSKTKIGLTSMFTDFGDFNNKEDKKKADDLKEKLKEKLEDSHCLIVLNMLRDKLRKNVSTPFEKKVLSMLKGCGAMWTTSPLLKSLILMKMHKKNVLSGTRKIVRWIGEQYE